MDDDDAIERAQRYTEWRQRTEDTLARADQVLANAQARQQARESAWAMPEPRSPGESDQRAPDAPIPPLRRPAHVPRDWVAEQKWIEQIIDRRLSTFTDGIGKALAEVARIEEAERWGPRVAALEADIKKLRTEIAALQPRPDKLSASIDRLGALLDRAERIGFGKRDEDDNSDIPLLN